MSLAYWENVNKEIKNKNTTQEYVSHKAGIKYHTFKGWIAKDVLPRIDDAIEIAGALGVSCEYLYRGRDFNVSTENQTLLDLARKYKDSLDDLEIIEPEKRKTIIEMLSMCAEMARKTPNQQIV